MFIISSFAVATVGKRKCLKYAKDQNGNGAVTSDWAILALEIEEK